MGPDRYPAWALVPLVALAKLPDLASCLFIYFHPVEVQFLLWEETQWVVHEDSGQAV